MIDLDMTLLIIFLICLFVTLFIGVMAGFSDVRSMTIPNAYSVYVILSFFIAFAALYLGGQDAIFASITSHLLSGVFMFVASAVLFALGIIGAGDSKFATACAFWVGVKYVPVFLLFMTIFGGLLGVVALVIKRKKPFKNPLEGSWVYQVQGGADKVPYGVAITFGMVVAFVYSGYFSSGVMHSFMSLS